MYKSGVDIKEAKIVPGSFIPHRAILESQNKEKKLRKVVLSTLASFLCTVSAFGYYNYSTRVSSAIANVPIVIQSASVYSSTGVATSAPDSLSDYDEYQRVVRALAAEHRSFLAINTVDKNVTVYRSGQEVLAAPILRSPEDTSWRFVPAGIYRVTNLAERQFSAVQEAYFNHSIQFSKNYLLHGSPEKVNGLRAERGVAGIELSASDAAAIYTLTTSDMPVVVHSANTIKPKLSYTNRGPGIDTAIYKAIDIVDGATITYSGDSESPVPIASLTKLMTALVVAESYDIDGEVVVEQEKYVDTLIPRLDGIGRTTTYNLLQLLLTESSNESAEVLASVMGREKFIEKMNITAKRLGLNNTSFVDPSGLGEGNTSSLSDLGKLTQHIYNTQPFLWKLTIQPEAVLSERPDDFVALQNFNLVDGLDDLIGGKIGETAAAGQTSISLHHVEFNGQEREIVIILLGSKERGRDVRAIHEYVLTHF